MTIERLIQSIKPGFERYLMLRVARDYIHNKGMEYQPNLDELEQLLNAVDELRELAKKQ